MSNTARKARHTRAERGPARTDSPQRARKRRPKVKQSIALDAGQLAWLAHVAKAKDTSVSALVGEAIERLRHRHKLVALLDLVGGSEDITDADVEFVESEWRNG